jgi:hypothetical protein
MPLAEDDWDTIATVERYLIHPGPGQWAAKIAVFLRFI